MACNLPLFSSNQSTKLPVIDRKTAEEILGPELQGSAFPYGMHLEQFVL
ncbi:MAG: hypothetical protein KQH63_19305 [Desulfobulbaceae bacterium]|nr:hypothetical protein [Desulfobulbaceae bacterium]